MIEAAKGVLIEWLEAVNKGNVEKLLELYDRKAVLIPTFSNRLLNTPDKQKDYFVNLAKRENLSVKLHEKTLIIQKLQDNIFSLSGIYDWRFAVDGEILDFEARFSYILDLSKPSPILHHHSSQSPHML